MPSSERHDQPTASGMRPRLPAIAGHLTQGHGEKLLALALEATSDGVWVWHIPTGEAFFSPRYYTMLGYAPDEFPASLDAWAGLLHPDDLETTKALIQSHIENRSESYEVEFRLKTASGAWLWIMGRGKVAEWDAVGKPVLLVGSHINIDARKRTEDQLAAYRESLEEMVRERTAQLEQTTSLLEATFNAIPDVLGVQDGHHHIIRYNAAGYQFLNKTHEEVANRRCYELIGRNKQCDICATSECYRTKRPSSVERYEEALDAWLDVRAYPILDESGNIVKVIEHLRDITPQKTAEAENRRLHEKLQNAQKMESLGTLAGGVAHDFNNLLMGIQGRISLLAMDILSPSGMVKEHIDAIEEYIRSATNLTKQLLGFARGGKYEVKPFDLNQLVVESAAMFGRTQKDIQIRIHTAPDAITVEADRHQIEQVLLNLYINAFHAVHADGLLHLETTIAKFDETRCRPHQVGPGNYAKVSVTDNGIGIDASILPKIFDPFFTTKEKGRGTGLGLASAYGIIKNHGGFITVYSEVGLGSTFNLHLPLSQREAHPDRNPADVLVKGSETVLLVDDEDMILDVCRGMLEKLGYRVIVARGGEQAVDMVDQHGAAIGLVILDMIMPGMDGDQAFDCIRGLRPSLPVLLSSGYAINGQATAIMQKGCNGFIQKPFNIAELSQKIRQTLADANKGPVD